MEFLSAIFEIVLSVYFFVVDFFFGLLSYFIPPEHLSTTRTVLMIIIAFIFFRALRLGRLLGIILSFIGFLFLLSTLFLKGSLLGLF